jgi:hypothetical protein
MENISTYVAKKPTYDQVIDKPDYILLFIRHIDPVTGDVEMSVF